MRPEQVADGVHRMAQGGANVYFVAVRGGWVLVDTAWPWSAAAIRRAADALFGPQAPEAILLTHAHPDHDGAAAALAAHWGVQVFLDAGDMPLVTKSITQKPELMDPVGKPLLALARLLPRGGRRPPPLAAHLAPLPDLLPWLPGWQIVPTPGHSAGHVSFFRTSDRVLLSGDAVLTAALGGLVPWILRLSLPPRPTSLDWEQAKRSVVRLAALAPELIASGHGRVMRGAGPALAAFAAGLGSGPGG